MSGGAAPALDSGARMAMLAGGVLADNMVTELELIALNSADPPAAP